MYPLIAKQKAKGVYSNGIETFGSSNIAYSISKGVKVGSK